MAAITTGRSDMGQYRGTCSFWKSLPAGSGLAGLVEAVHRGAGRLRGPWPRAAGRQRSRGRPALGLEALEPRALLDASVVISEIVASNRHGLLDFDDDRSDWLELFNASGEAVDLSGYFLSDDAANLRKWVFPEQTVLESSGRLVVFASGKDTVQPNGEIHANFKLAASGEPLLLTEPDGRTVVWQFETASVDGAPAFPPQEADVSYGPAPTRVEKTLLSADADISYLVPTTPEMLDSDWTALEFTDPQGLWTTAPMGNGIGFAQYASDAEPPADGAFASLIRTDVGSAMHDRNASVFVRSTFTASLPEMLAEPVLRVRYDDGFVAYLNGQQIAQRNAPADPAWNATATAARDDARAAGYEEIPLAVGARLRDFNATHDGTFVVDVPDGTYHVKVSLGELVKPREQTAVYLEGELREVLDTEAGQPVIRQYDVDVSDGQLAVRVEKQGGPRRNAVISGLEIASAAGGPVWRFDFGTFTSPVLPGFAQVTHASRYAPSVGYGWLSGEVTSNDRVPTRMPEEVLVEGTNVLAVQGLNVAAEDDDLFLQFALTAVAPGVDTTHFLYTDTPTPGEPNMLGRSAIAAPPRFSTAGGTFRQPLVVRLATDLPGGVIHYTLDETVPTHDSPIYDPASPLEITATTQVRAIVTGPDHLTSPIATETYVELGEDLRDFTSPIPIVVLDSLDEAFFPIRPFPPNRFQAAYWAIFEPGGEGGRSSLASAPDFQTRAGAQMRGNSSAGFPRKSFRLEAWDGLDRDLDVSPLGLPADSDWILNARSEFDRSLMNNALMYALSTESGLQGVRTRFVEVFVNTDHGPLTGDDYLGVYALMEKVKRGPDRVDVQKLSKNYTSEPLITGGYIVNLELEAQFREFGFEGGGRGRFQYVEPDPEEMILPIREAQVAYITNYMDRVAASLDDPDPVRGYPSLIDVDNWIDYHLLSTFAKNSDALDHSTYMSKDRGGKLKHGPLWDYDRALGARRQETQRKSFEGFQQRDFTMKWWVTLFEQSDFRQAYVDRYQQFRDGPWSDANLSRLIDRLAGEITPEAAARNYERWPHPLAGDPPSWLGEVEELRRWVLGRVAWTDTQFLPRPIVVAARGPLSPGDALPAGGTITLELPPTAPAGAEIYYTLDGSDPRMSFFEAGVEDPAARIAPAAVRYQGEAIELAAGDVLTARLFLPDSDRRLLLPSQTIDFSAPATVAVAAAEQPRIGPVVMSEVHYRPAPPSDAALQLDPTLTASGLEFIELHNPTSAAVPLAGWELREGITFSFAAGDRIDGDGTIVVVPFDPADPADAGQLAAFRHEYQIDDQVRLDGPYRGKLNNGGERVRLVRVDSGTAMAATRDSIDYDNRAPWPEIADGRSQSLHRKAPHLLGERAASWQAAPPSPGEVDLAIVADLDFDRDIDFDDIAEMVLALTDTNAYQDRFGVSATIGGDLNRDGAIDATDVDLFRLRLGGR